MYALTLSKPIIDELLEIEKKQEKLLNMFKMLNTNFNEVPHTTNFDYVWFISNDINLTMSVKDYFENLDNKPIIKSITMTSHETLKSLNLNEKFEIIEIDESYWDFLRTTFHYLDNLPEDNTQFMNFICIEGMNNTYLQGGKEATINYHNEYFCNRKLNDIRNHFSHIKNII